jgi:Protein of unknown function (DUF3343).
MDTLAPFKSRSEALRLYNSLKELNYAATVIDTPRRQGLSCGLSVVFSSRINVIAEDLINQNKLKSFQGFYLK